MTYTGVGKPETSRPRPGDTSRAARW